MWTFHLSGTFYVENTFIFLGIFPHAAHANEPWPTWTIPLLNIAHMMNCESGDHMSCCTGSRQVWRLTICSVCISLTTSRYWEQLAMYWPFGEKRTRYFVCWNASEKFILESENYFVHVKVYMSYSKLATCMYNNGRTPLWRKRFAFSTLNTIYIINTNQYS